jgi:NAD(P)-dependent dehydrogenase (short-subunit alcohol dehydrogenase family)
MKSTLITGSNGGVGSALCQKFFEENWNVIGLDIQNDSNHNFCHTYLKCNLENENEIKDCCKSIDNLYCLINNAAIQINKNIWEMSVEEWDKTMNINARSNFLLLKHTIELLKKSEGNIINIGSVHSVASSDKIAAYSCAKHALVGLTKNMAIELAPFNICVNCVSPGAIETSMLKKSLLRGHSGTEDEDTVMQKFKDKHLLKRICQPSELAELIFFMSTQKIINGENLIADGGISIKLSTE